ncbi:MAG TPA: hypothetical protein PKE58_06910, partial [Acidobacteriota bacterium]|nr:hypothetical protein [Acidobacteriota bacterium]
GHFPIRRSSSTYCQKKEDHSNMKSKATFIGIIVIVLLGATAIGVNYWCDNHSGGSQSGASILPPVAPTEWPVDIPFHPQAIVKSKVSNGTIADRYDLSVMLPKEEVLKFYQEKFKENGWIIDPSQKGPFQIWRNGNQKVGFQLFNRGKETGVAILVYVQTNKPTSIPQLEFPVDPETGLVDLPKSVPQYPRLKPKGEEKSPSGRLHYRYETADSFVQVRDFYQKAMSEQGWALKGDMSITEGDHPYMNQFFNKGEITVGIQVTSENKVTEVNYVLFEKNAQLPDMGITQKSQLKLETTPKTGNPELPPPNISVKPAPDKPKSEAKKQ